MNLKISKKNLLTTEEELSLLESQFELPKWAYLTSEWNEYLMKKNHLRARLRKMQGDIEYNNYEVIE